MGGTKRKFFCECGLKKHEIEKQKDQELIKACLFGEIDGNMGVEVKCFCKTCKMYIWYIDLRFKWYIYDLTKINN